MPDVHKKTRTRRLLLTDAKANQPLDLLRPGMPAIDSIHDDSVTFKARGRTYRILKTKEVDTYETSRTAVALGKVLKGKRAPAPAAIAAAVKTAPPAGEDFAGTARKAAKLSIAAAPTQNFTDLSKLIASLPAVSPVANLHNHN